MASSPAGSAFGVTVVLAYALHTAHGACTPLVLIRAGFQQEDGVVLDAMLTGDTRGSSLDALVEVKNGFYDSDDRDIGYNATLVANGVAQLQYLCDEKPCDNDTLAKRSFEPAAELQDKLEIDDSDPRKLLIKFNQNIELTPQKYLALGTAKTSVIKFPDEAQGGLVNVKLRIALLAGSVLANDPRCPPNLGAASSGEGKVVFHRPTTTTVSTTTMSATTISATSTVRSATTTSSTTITLSVTTATYTSTSTTTTTSTTITLSITTSSSTTYTTITATDTSASITTTSSTTITLSATTSSSMTSMTRTATDTSTSITTTRSTATASSSMTSTTTASSSMTSTTTTATDTVTSITTTGSTTITLSTTTSSSITSTSASTTTTTTCVWIFKPLGQCLSPTVEKCSPVPVFTNSRRLQQKTCTANAGVSIEVRSSGHASTPDNFVQGQDIELCLVVTSECTDASGEDTDARVVKNRTVTVEFTMCMDDEATIDANGGFCSNWGIDPLRGELVSAPSDSWDPMTSNIDSRLLESSEPSRAQIMLLSEMQLKASEKRELGTLRRTISGNGLRMKVRAELDPRSVFNLAPGCSEVAGAGQGENAIEILSTTTTTTFTSTTTRISTSITSLSSTTTVTFTTTTMTTTTSTTFTSSGTTTSETRSSTTSVTFTTTTMTTTTSTTFTSSGTTTSETRSSTTVTSSATTTTSSSTTATSSSITRSTSTTSETRSRTTVTDTSSSTTTTTFLELCCEQPVASHMYGGILTEPNRCPPWWAPGVGLEGKVAMNWITSTRPASTITTTNVTTTSTTITVTTMTRYEEATQSDAATSAASANTFAQGLHASTSMAPNTTHQLREKDDDEDTDSALRSWMLAAPAAMFAVLVPNFPTGI